MFNILSVAKNFIKVNPENSRTVYFLGKEQTEFQAMRKEYSIRAGEVAKELGISGSKYSGIDSGKTKMTEEEYDLMYYKVRHAIHRINKRNQQYVEVDTGGRLIYNPLTRKTLDEALILLARGKTLYNVASTLGVDEKELEKTIAYLATTSEEMNEIYLSCIKPVFS